MKTYLQRIVSLRLHTLVSLEVFDRFGVLPTAAQVAWWFHPLRAMYHGNSSWSDQTWNMWFKSRLAADAVPLPGVSDEPTEVAVNWPAVTLHVGWVRRTETEEERKRLTREFWVLPPPTPRAPRGRRKPAHGGVAS